MSVVVVGLEHRHTPLDLLERIAVTDVDVPKVLGQLRDCANVQEAVVLSTCLRTEVYLVVDRFHDGVAEAQQVLVDRAGLSPADLEPTVQIHFDDDVARHVFAVASGLESVVPGESEVLGQVRRAWDRARSEGATGPVLSGLFRHAVQTGKRVRAETAIARGSTSFSHAALDLAEAHVEGGLAGSTVAVLGAGGLAAGLVTALAGRSPARAVSRVRVINRSVDHAAQLVATVSPAGRGGDASRGAAGGPALVPVDLADAEGALADAALVLCAVDADAPILSAAQLAPEGDRAAWPVVVVDLGVPRNVEAAVGFVSGVTLLDMDDLRSAVGRAMDDRRGELDAARAIIDDEVASYRAASRARGAAPVVAALRTHLEQLRLAELDRRRGQSPDLSDAAWAQVDDVTRAVLAKLVHEPTVQLKETAGSPRGERLVEALRTLFDL